MASLMRYVIITFVINKTRIIIRKEGGKKRKIKVNKADDEKHTFVIVMNKSASIITPGVLISRDTRTDNQPITLDRVI